MAAPRRSRPRHRPARRALAGALLLVTTGPLLAACTDDDGGRRRVADEGASSSPSGSPRSERSGTSSPETSPSDSPGGASALPPGGTVAKPAAVEARTQPLDWQQVLGSVEDTVTTSGARRDWTLRVDEAGHQAELEGPGSGDGFGAGPRERISDTLLDDRYAVVVWGDEQETRPQRAEVSDRRSGKRFTIDGSSDLPTATGGTWALGEGRLLHATVHRGSYCVASVDLDSERSTLGWCAPKRHGFNSARITPAGDSLLTFDDSQPSCRTVVRLDGTEVEPFPGVADCKGWDGLVTEDGAVWSSIPKERRIEEARVYARVGDDYYDLGPATAGSLTWCHGAAYFTQDPQTDKGPARLLRWSSTDGLTVAYQTSGGHAFVEEPRCGADALTITARAEGGDEQVTAALG